MTPTRQNLVHLPLEEGEQDGSNFQSFPPTTQASVFPYSVIFNSPLDQGESGTTHHDHCHQQEQEPLDLLLKSGPSETVLPSTTSSSSRGKSSNIIVQSLHCKYYRHDVHGSVKSMVSPRMRWMRKMMMSDRVVTSKLEKCKQAHQDHTSDCNDTSPSGFIRMCSNCNTTKTPLWRSGPRGPKSLCNACGIRQRKARRAMEAAAAIGGGLISPAPGGKPCKVRKEKLTTHKNCILPYKKRCKIINAASNSLKKLPIDHDTVKGLSKKSSAFHHVFPQDEEDAAILLMALSCGLIHG